MDTTTISDSTSRPHTPAVKAERAPHIRWLRNLAIARVRFGNGRRCDVPIPSAKTEAQAKARAVVVAELAFRMRKANVDPAKVRELLMHAGAAATDTNLRSVRNAVEKIVGGEVVLAGVPTAPTIRTVGERWTSGDLARTYPDQVRLKRSSTKDVQRLVKYIYPLVGNIAIDRFELDDAERVMRELPAKLSSTTRKQIGHLLSRILTLSVYPLRLITHNPIPKGFLPKKSRVRARSYLFPSEDTTLLACTKVPLQLRLLYGWCTREGMRLGEVLQVTPAHINFERGTINLDKNKTDDSRGWKLAPGVARAIRVYLDRYRPNIKPNDPIFVAPNGRPFTEAVLKKLARKFRGHLRTAGIHRTELFVSSAERMPIGIHDLRGTFVTLSLAAGCQDTWVCDRTGHKDARMLRLYKRPARRASELDDRLGGLDALDVALPELRVAGGNTTTPPPAAPAHEAGGVASRAGTTSPSRAPVHAGVRASRAKTTTPAAAPAHEAGGDAPQPGHKVATASAAPHVATAAIATASHRKAAARGTLLAGERRSPTIAQNAAETAVSRENRGRSSRIVGAHGQHVAKVASHGAAPTDNNNTAATARANLENALAAALTRATDASAWEVVRDVSRAIEVALATGASHAQHTPAVTTPPVQTPGDVIDLETARHRQPR